MAEMTREEIAALIVARFPDNASRFITPARLREVVGALLDSTLFAADSPWTSAIATAIAAAASAYATAAQGATADSAVQPAAMTSAIDAAIAALAPVVEIVTSPPGSPVAGRFYVIAAT